MVADDLIWCTYVGCLMGTTQLRKLRRANLLQSLLVNFHQRRFADLWTSSVLLLNLTETSLLEINSVCISCCLRTVHNILHDSTDPAYHLFYLLPSRRKYRSNWARTSRLSHRQWGCRQPVPVRLIFHTVPITKVDFALLQHSHQSSHSLTLLTLERLMQNF